MTNPYVRGSVYWVDMTPYYKINSTISYKKRPCILINANKASLHNSSVTVIPCTTKNDNKSFHPHIIIDGEDAYLMPEQIMTVHKSELDSFTGVLDDDDMEKVNNCLIDQLGLDGYYSDYEPQVIVNEQITEKVMQEQKTTRRIWTDEMKTKLVVDYSNTPHTAKDQQELADRWGFKYVKTMQTYANLYRRQLKM